MNIRRFLGVVPKAVQIWSLVIWGCAVLIAVGMGFHEAQPGTALRTMSIYASAGLVSGVVAAAWLLCLGFVFADARRRGMRAFLWVLVAALFPHLLGFLLYFVLRKPLTTPCPSCARAMSPEQPFCSWCGSSRSVAPVPSQEGLAAK